MEKHRNYNEYLFFEFGYDDEYQDTKISETWPFKLNFVDSFEISGTSYEIFEFKDGDDGYYLVDGSSLTFYQQGGLEPHHLKMLLTGSHWIGAKDPIDLNTSKIGDESVPRIPDRQQKIEQLYKKHLNCSNCTILEGLFLKTENQYIALVKSNEDETTSIVGDKLVVRNIPFSNLSSWKRLSLGVGNLIISGKLKG